jgi:hypothetical protein
MQPWSNIITSILAARTAMFFVGKDCYFRGSGEKRKA